MDRITDRPNILYIMADQFRHDWLGCAGNGSVRTPHLDRLAERGVRFTTCCTNSPVCAPARIALATGQQPHRVGALSNQAYLPLSAPTYYQRLRNHSYYVGCVGKLDLAKPDPYNGYHGDRPVTYAWGFTHPVEAEGKMHAGSSPTPIGPYTRYLHEQGLLERFHQDYRERNRRGFSTDCRDSVLPAEAHEDAWIGRRSATWIEQIPRDFPFHLFVSFVGPHDPFDPPAHHAEHFRDAPMPEPIGLPDQRKPRHIRQRAFKRGGAEEAPAVTPEQILTARRQYSAAVELIDDHVGLILDGLEARGLMDQTYIVFGGDHGEMLGDHGLFTKHTAYESALRLPLIVAGPGIAGGRTSDAIVELIDIGATICDLAGLPPQPGIDARSFRPVLEGSAQAHRSEAITAEINYRAVRTERYTYIENFNDVPELYDNQEDPAQQHNLAEEQPQLRNELHRRMMRRFLEGAWNH